MAEIVRMRKILMLITSVRVKIQLNLLEVINVWMLAADVQDAVFLVLYKEPLEWKPYKLVYIVWQAEVEKSNYL